MPSHLVVAILWPVYWTFTTALVCYNCPGILHPRFCEYVKECSTDQVCGIERKVDINGAVVFNTGCMNKNTCQTSPSVINGIQECYHCCSSDLCNSYGCGEQDISVGNGTMCYNCLGALKREDCQYVTFCDISKMCYIEERTHFGEAFYNSGCKEKHVCDTQNQFNPIIGRRRSTTQFSCCGSQLCNNGGQDITTTSGTTLPVTSTDTITVSTTTQAMCNCLNDGYCQKGHQACICRGGYLGDHCQYTNGKDKHFIVIFHQGYIYDNNQHFVPKIIVPSDRPARLSVHYFTNHNTSFVIDKDNFEYTLSNSVLMTDGVHKAGAEIHSNVSISLYGLLFNQFYGVSEGLFVIPTRFASREFVIPTYQNFHERSAIAISSLYENTDVNITLKMKGTLAYENVNYSDGDIIQKTVSKYSTFQLSGTPDLSGSMVTASHPVIIVSGNTMTTSHANTVRNSDNQPFMEMVLPINQLDNLYIIPQISTRSNNTVRVQAVNDTVLSLNIGNKTTTQTLNSRDYFDFVHSTVSYIRSTENVLVMIYPYALTNANGDSFMMTIHGVNQYLPEYDFAVPTGFQSFISVTVLSDGLGDFVLDNKAINIKKMYSLFENSDQFSTFSMSVTSGFHRIQHSRKLRFGLWIYGNQNPYDAYGYPAGIAFKTHN